MNEQETIVKSASQDTQDREEAARQAWRGWVIPAVGSMAFFSSMIINGWRNYQTYGFPSHVFSRTDKALLGLPIVVVVLALSDLVFPYED